MSRRTLGNRSRRLGGRVLVTLTVLALTTTATGLSSATAQAGSATRSSVPAAGQDPLPEPTEAQFLDGPIYVAPTGPPAADASDPGPGPVDSRSTETRALGPGTYTCSGYAGIDTKNPPSALMADTFAWGPFTPYRVGDGTGNVNWRVNPYRNPSWYMWLHSLRWLGQGITAGSEGDLVTLEHTAAIARDWVKDNPYSWKSDIGAWESTMHRTNVLVCLRQSVLAAYGVSVLPTPYAWLNASLHDHAKFLINNWSGAWNHGTDESMVLFGVGCLLNRADYRNLAVTRLDSSITTAIDSQGSTNEQSTAYAQMNYGLWGTVEEVLLACNAVPSATISARRALLATWIAHATSSNGTLHQIGDSEQVKTIGYPGTPLEYAASAGTSGVAPRQRVAIYKRGYVFGRSGWGSTVKPFAQESTYSIRYGRSRAVHGHNDHMALTYTARGRTILVDGGHAGYQNDSWRAWARGTTAHSSMTTPKAAVMPINTDLTRYLIKDTSDFFEFRDQPGVGVSRTRGVLVLKDPDLVVTLDRATSQTWQQFQTLWNLPADQKATVYSRTTAIAAAPGDTMRTILFQIPYKQELPRGAILVKRAQTSPILGWQYPDIFHRKAAPTAMFARQGTRASILSVIAPVSATGVVMYKVRASGTSTIVDFTVDGKKVSVLISAGGGLVRQ
ncbi:hypothetical protein E3T33_00400 [Cryobacterium sp. TMT1-2-1]|nr:hypothetical protein E3T33_00400 [Cryobacterium sp. TMT1-2-1]